MEKLKNPPLNLVSIRIDIPSNLKISESRSAYHELIKSDYPLIVFPETKALMVDWSDVYFRNQNNNTQVRISTNYFIFDTTHYDKVDSFWKNFQSVFQKFVIMYSIKTVNALNLSYQNILILDEKLVGKEFTDYFAFAVNFKDHPARTLVACDGVFVYNTTLGRMKLDVRPQQNTQSQKLESLNFTIDFFTNTPILIDEKLSEVKKVFNAAHTHIEDAFKSSLTEKYFQTLI